MKPIKAWVAVDKKTKRIFSLRKTSFTKTWLEYNLYPTKRDLLKAGYGVMWDIVPVTISFK